MSKSRKKKVKAVIPPAYTPIRSLDYSRLYGDDKSLELREKRMDRMVETVGRTTKVMLEDAEAEIVRLRAELSITNQRLKMIQDVLSMKMGVAEGAHPLRRDMPLDDAFEAAVFGGT